MRLKSMMKALAASAVMAFALSPVGASAWSLEEAAKPYAGTTLDVVFLLRPGYEAAKKMLPEFEEKTGIKINITDLPYENALGEQVRDFVANGDIEIGRAHV